MKNPRQTAFEILMKIEKASAFSNLASDNALNGSALSVRDRAFVSALIHITLKRRLTLDYQIERYLTKPLSSLKKNVLTILRLGACQLLFMDKVPVSAAVNESVRLSKDNGAGYASGLINAVLRKIAENGCILPENDGSVHFLSIRYSCPENLISMWIKAYGRDNTLGILEKSLEKSRTFIRVNTLKTTSDELIKILRAEGVSVTETEEKNGALEILNLGGQSVESLESFRKGLFHVQGLASQICAEVLGAKEGERIIDLCAAPGGKSFTIAQMMSGKGELLSCDVYPHRTALIDSGAQRLGLDCITTCVADASKFYSRIEKADRVLCDVPCSGLGVISSKPEIKYKELDSFKALPDLQYEILSNAAKYLKKGGRLVYSTCTLNKKENDKVCDRFLNEHPEFKCVHPIAQENSGNYYTFFPHISGTDGFFIAAFELSEECE